MVKKKGGLIAQMKEAVRKSGTNKGKFLYFKSGSKIRVRFLVDLDSGFKIPFHDSFQLGINVPCQTLFDRECRHCDDEELRHRDVYAWPVYDYDANEVKILMAAVNNSSPVPQLIGFYDSYGTVIDRDYVITRNGSGTSTNYSVVPMDKVAFRNKKAKPIVESKFMELLDKAFPDEDAEEDEAPKKKKKKARKEEPEQDWEDDEEIEEDEELDYNDMSARELYDLCKERELNVKPKGKKAYYIDRLEEYDEEEIEEDEEEEDDEW